VHNVPQEELKPSMMVEASLGAVHRTLVQPVTMQPLKVASATALVRILKSLGRSIIGHAQVKDLISQYRV